MLNLKKISCLTIILLINLLILISGCAKYNAKQLKTPNTLIKQKEDLDICKKIFTESDCQEYFDRKLIKRGYQPIQIYIKNNSDQTFILNSNNIKLPLEPVKNVADSVHRDVAWKTTKYFLILSPILGALEGFNSYEVNKKIDSDYHYKSIDEKDCLEIKPGGVLNKIVFISNENIQTNFDLTLVNSTSKEKITFEL